MEMRIAKPMNPTRQFHHCALVVADLEASLNWYQDKLDFIPESRFYLPEAQLDITYLVSPGGFRLELLARRQAGIEANETASPPNLISPGRMHICFEVEAIEAAAETLRAREVAFVQQPKTIEAAGVKNFWISDLEGNRIEFMEILP
jgi:catechol 2,3-dioxygenase-like lactoylglutathione lyase family enzyme